MNDTESLETMPIPKPSFLKHENLSSRRRSFGGNGVSPLSLLRPPSVLEFFPLASLTTSVFFLGQAERTLAYRVWRHPISSPIQALWCLRRLTSRMVPSTTYVLPIHPLSYQLMFMYGQDGQALGK